MAKNKKGISRAKRPAAVLCALGMTLSVWFLIGCGGCELYSGSDNEERLIIMTYNVQNLFDTMVTGNEYPEYTPEGGWTAQQYERRLETTARAIVQGHGAVPDIVVLQEIEHIGVLEDLLVGPLASRGYQWYVATTDTDSAIQTGIMSRFPIDEVRNHSLEGLRSVLEVLLDVDGQYMTLFALHGKSRREGVQETAPSRIAMTRMISERVTAIHTHEPLLPVIVAGDFNVSADTYFRESQEYQTALIPLQSDRAEFFRQQGSLIVGGSPPSQGYWYTWWLDPGQKVLAELPGSYWYRGVWETFDHILLSPGFFDGYGLEFVEGRVGATPMLLDENRRPYRWDVGKGVGVSDHLPVLVVLER